MKQFFTLLAIVISFSLFSQTQIGSDIIGENPYDGLGDLVSFSDDGTKFLVTAWDYAQVFEFDGTDWVQLGNNIPTPESIGSRSSTLSGDGLKLAIGSKEGNSGTFSGQVLFYEYNGSDWVQLNETIFGSHLDYFGSAVDMSYDGNRIAIGARVGVGGEFKGRTSIYEHNGSAWTKIGSDIFGANEDDELGRAISMSHDGNIVALGTRKIGSPNPGYARVYEYNGSDWVQLGNNILGTEGADRFGYAISLSEDGKIVAIGAELHGNTNTGLVQVYQFINNVWEQLGEDITGEGNYDFFGVSVSISNDGTILAVGAAESGYTNPFGAEDGSVRIFSFNGSDWENANMDIDGETIEYFGYSVSLSGDGSSVLCSSPSYNLIENEGRVRAFSLEIETSIINDENDLSYRIYPNPTTNKVEIDLTKNFRKVEVELYNILGERLSVFQFQDKKNLSLELGFLNKGIYFARIKLNHDKSQTVKITKE